LKWGKLAASGVGLESPVRYATDQEALSVYLDELA